MRRKEANESLSLRCVSKKSRWIIYRMLNKKERLNQNKKTLRKQTRATRREHDDIERKCFRFFFVNYLYCSDDRTKKEKNHNIHVAKKQTHERDQTIKTKRNQCLDDNNETNVEKKRSVNNLSNLALIESKDAREAREKYRCWEI